MATNQLIHSSTNDTISIIAKYHKEVSEMIRFNRSLDKLRNNPLIKNGEEFIKSNLLELRGPYLEFIPSPQMDNKTFLERAKEWGLNHLLVESIIKELFKGDPKGRLYKHQAEFIDLSLSDEGRDIIISVPTASGKTESFMIPILQECLTSDRKGIKSVILYPTKTLGADQCGRFIKYVWQINKQSHLNQITIGIWDGSTPRRLDNTDQLSVFRGIRCPNEVNGKRCNSPLFVSSNGIVHCNECGEEFNWIRPTREKITQHGVDILIATPEALEYLIVDPEERKRDLTGTKPLEVAPRYLVLDEAHVWKGISGTAMNLFIQRLKYLWGNQLQVLIASATVKEPINLVQMLTSKSKELISEVTLTKLAPKYFADIIEKYLEIKQFFNQNRLDPNQYIEIMDYLNKIYLNGNEIKNAKEIHLFLKNKFLTSQFISNFVEGDHNLEISKKILELITYLRNLTEFSEYEAKAIITLLMFHYLAILWQFLIQKTEKSKLVINFFSLKELRDFITKNYQDLIKYRNVSTDDLLIELLSQGMQIKLFNSKFHTFVKGLSEVYYCEKCKNVYRFPKCPKCQKENIKLKFCSRCHNVFYVKNVFIEEDNEKFEFEELYDLETNEKVDDTCPSCGLKFKSQWDIRDGAINYPTLVEFSTTVLTRLTNSKKLLIFTDSRQLTETLARNMIKNDYKFQTQRKIIEILLNSPDHSISFKDLTNELRKFLHETFLSPIKKIVEKSSDSSVSNLLKTFEEQNLQKLNKMSSFDSLFQAGLLTEKHLNTFKDPIPQLIGNYILRELSMGKRKKTINKVEIKGMSIDNLRKDLKEKLRISETDIDYWLPNVLESWHSNKIITWVKKSYLKNLKNKKLSNSEINEIIRKLENKLHEFNFPKIYDDDELPIFKFNYASREFRNNFNFSFPEYRTLCLNCYQAFPADVKYCPVCGSNNVFSSKLSLFITGEIPKKVKEKDYWFNQLVLPYTQKDKEYLKNKLATWVHTGNLLDIFRNAVEQLFSKDKEPDINATFATSTMELGVDIGNLDSILMVGLPPTPSNYIQRAGRAGRTIGKPAIVITIIRNSQPIDEYYYTDLEKRYFSSLPKMRIPTPLSSKNILFSHLNSLIMIYLSRNPDPERIYEKIFYSSEQIKTEHLTSIVTIIKSRIRNYIVLIKHKKYEEIKSLLDAISETFDYSTKIDYVLFLDELISSDENSYYSIKNRFRRYLLRKGILSYIQRRGKGAHSFYHYWKQIKEENILLSNILANLGLLNVFRSIGEEISLTLQGKDEEEKVVNWGYDIHRAINELYPGENEKNGAIFTYMMTRYQVRKVNASTINIFEGYYCQNKNCGLVLDNDYNIKDMECPRCKNQSLTPIKVYEPDKIVIKSIEYEYYTTSPLVLRKVHKLQDIRSSSSGKLIKNPNYSAVTFLEFTPEYLYKHINSGRKTWLKSNAIIEAVSQSDDEDLLDFDIDNNEINFEDENIIQYAPIGYKIETNSFNFVINLKYFDVLEEEQINQIIPSSQQAIKRAFSILTEADLNDFEVLVELENNQKNPILKINIIEAKLGGNGLGEIALNNINEFEKIIMNIINCNNCIHYCEECLLLPSTPPQYLEENLLSRQILLKIFKLT